MSEDVQNEKVIEAEDVLLGRNDLEHEEICTRNENMTTDGQSGSMFIVELLICSLVLWIFLFLMGSSRYGKIIFKTEEILSTKTSVTMISDIEQQVELTLEKLLTD